jgi:hypothetical protein
VLYATPIPILQHTIDGKHFAELQQADALGMLPDAYDKLNALANVFAACSMKDFKQAIDLRPKPPVTIEQKRASEIKIGKQAQRLVWRT